MNIKKQRMDNINKVLSKLFEEKFSEIPLEINLIPGGVSDRKISRLISDNHTAIGIYNKKIKENIAFIEFTKTFKKHNLNVPEIYIKSSNNKFYIEEDLGNKSLFNVVSEKKIPRNSILSLFEKALKDLVKFQVAGKDDINYNYCYETKFFDKYQVKYDFHKFWKYYYLKFVKNASGKKIKSKTLDLLTNKLMNNSKKLFMYRDFQPRNVMVKNNSLYYIDYQSGRKGPPEYDVASILFSGSHDLTVEEKHYLLNFYIKELRKKISYNKNEFLSNYYYFVIIRLLQVLGSYGFSYFRKKDNNMLIKMRKAKINIKSILPKIKDDLLLEFLRIVSE